VPLAPGALARIAVPNPHARVLELVGDVSGLLDPDEFCDGLFAALQAALPSDYVSLNQVASEPERNWSIVEPPLSDEHHATFYRLALQNPLAERFLRTRDGRPCASRTSSRRHSSTPPTSTASSTARCRSSTRSRSRSPVTTSTSSRSQWWWR